MIPSTNSFRDKCLKAVQRNPVSTTSEITESIGHPENEVREELELLEIGGEIESRMIGDIRVWEVPNDDRGLDQDEYEELIEETNSLLDRATENDEDEDSNSE